MKLLLRQRDAVAIGLALLWGCLIVAAQWVGAFDPWEEPLVDWRLSIPGRVPPPDADLVLLSLEREAAGAVDSDTEGRARARLDYALVLRALVTYAPQSVVLEPLFNEPDAQYEAFDQSLAGMLARTNRAVLAGAALQLGTGTLRGDIPPVNLNRLVVRGRLDDCPQFDRLIWPMDLFARRAAVGIGNLSPDADGHCRRLPLVFVWQGQVTPSLALQAAAARLGASMERTEVLLGDRINLRDNHGRLLRSVPIDNEGRLRLRFRLRAAPVWQVNFDDILIYASQADRGVRPDQDLRVLRDRQIWIGYAAPDTAPVQTVVGGLPPVRVQMTAVRNILDEDFLRPLSSGWLLILFLLVSVLAVKAILHWDYLLGGCLLVVLNISWWQIGRALFVRHNWVLPLVSFAVLCAGAFALALASRYWNSTPTPDEPEEKEEIKAEEKPPTTDVSLEEFAEGKGQAEQTPKPAKIVREPVGPLFAVPSDTPLKRSVFQEKESKMPPPAPVRRGHPGMVPPPPEEPNRPGGILYWLEGVRRHLR